MEEMNSEHVLSTHEEKACCGKGACSSHKDTPEEKGAWIVAGAVLLGALMVAASILVSLKSGGALGTANAPAQAVDTNKQAQVKANPQKVTTTLDDDAIMGDKKKAQVAIIEFSDFECPFCKQFHQSTYNTLVKEYVESGKAVISFRDYPLPFHEPKASAAANTAQCVKQAKGDGAYFQFVKLYFENTLANAKGLPEGKMDEILKQIGVNGASVTKCAADEKFKDEIAKDMSDGQAIGVTGTPSFVIGKLTADGKVEGELLIGALPLAEFKATIEKYLE